MKLLYIANARIPTDRANGGQIVKSCEALKAAGVDITLCVPKRIQEDKFKGVDPFNFYRIAVPFEISYLFTFDLLFLVKKLPHIIGLVIYAVEEFSFALSVLFKYYQSLNSVTIYTRCLTVALLVKLVSSKTKVYYEAHDISGNKLTRDIYFYLVSLLNGVAVISKGLEIVFRDGGIKNLAFIPGAADVEQIKKIDAKTAQQELRIKGKSVVYTGRLVEPKGVYTFLKAANHILKKRKDLYFYFIGDSTPTDLSKLRHMANDSGNIIFTGPVAPQKCFSYQKSASVLVLPNSAKFDNSREYTSPQKLFEYLACGVPIVAADVLSNRSILSNNVDAVLVSPDDHIKLSEGILKIINDEKLAKEISKKALKTSLHYSWSARAKRILDFI